MGKRGDCEQWKKPISKGYRVDMTPRPMPKVLEEMRNQKVEKNRLPMTTIEYKWEAESLQSVGRKIGDCRDMIREHIENESRIVELVADVLAEFKVKADGFIPSDLPTKLLLAGREIEGRQVTRLIQSRSELNRLRYAERNLCSQYARMKAKSSVKPPWSD